MDFSLFTFAAATRLDDERRRRAFDVPVQQAVALACADTFSAASSTVFGAYYGGASAKERSEYARQESNSYHNRKRYTWKDANIVGLRAGTWCGKKTEGVKGVAWCHATAAAPKWLQEHCGTNPETPVPLGLYLHERDGHSRCLRLAINAPIVAGSKRDNMVQARFTLEGEPRKKWRKSDPNPFDDGLLVFHEFTENEENPLSAKTLAEAAAGRKTYTCQVCGQPKKGHVCPGRAV